MKIKEIIDNLMATTKKKEPEICIGLGIGGSVTALILGIAATPKAMRRLEKKKKEKKGPLTTIEKIKTAGPCYIPAITMEAMSIGLTLQGNHLHEKNTAALATAYAVANTSLRDVKEAIADTLGEKKERQIESAAVQKQVDRAPMPEEFVEYPETDHPGHGDVRTYEPICGRYFWSDRERIERAVNKLNWQKTRGLIPYVSLNEFYYEIDLPPTEAGDKLGWDENTLISVRFDSRLKDGRYPVMVVVFEDDGKPDYGFEYK